MSEQITWSRFIGPSLPESLVLANYQSSQMTIGHQETWNSCQRVLCCHIWIILRNTWIWRIIAKYFLRSFSKYFWEQSDTINQLIIADLQSDEWRRRKTEKRILPSWTDSWGRIFGFCQAKSIMIYDWHLLAAKLIFLQQNNPEGNKQ